MSAVVGIKSELVSRRKERDEAARGLDVSHAAYVKAKSIFEADQGRVDFLSKRIWLLRRALAVLEEDSE